MVTSPDDVCTSSLVTFHTLAARTELRHFLAVVSNFLQDGFCHIHNCSFRRILFDREGEQVPQK